MTREYIAVDLGDGTAWAQRRGLESASEQPLAAWERAILALHAEVERLRAEVDKQTVRANAYGDMAADANRTLGGIDRNERLRDAAARVMAELAERDKELERARAWIEERAGEYHVCCHSSPGKDDRFWGCTRGMCPSFAAFLRGLTRFRCKAREAGSAGGSDPQDCDWPFCGCLPEASAVLEAVEESGRFVPRAEAELLRAELAAARQRFEAAVQRIGEQSELLSRAAEKAKAPASPVCSVPSCGRPAVCLRFTSVRRGGDPHETALGTDNWLREVTPLCAEHAERKPA